MVTEGILIGSQTGKTRARAAIEIVGSAAMPLLGATAVAGHRIVANLAALCYMLPLALAIATLAQVGQAAGARDWPRSRAAIGAGLLLAGGLSTLLGVLFWVSVNSALYASSNLFSLPSALLDTLVSSGCMAASATLSAFLLRRGS